MFENNRSQIMHGNNYCIRCLCELTRKIGDTILKNPLLNPINFMSAMDIHQLKPNDDKRKPLMNDHIQFLSKCKVEKLHSQVPACASNFDERKNAIQHTPLQLAAPSESG